MHVRAAKKRLPMHTLRQHLAQYITADVSQAEVASLVPIRQPRVVEAQAMQDRSLQVVDVNTVFDGMVTQLIGLPYDVAAAHTTPG